MSDRELIALMAAILNAQGQLSAGDSVATAEILLDVTEECVRERNRKKFNS